MDPTVTNPSQANNIANASANPNIISPLVGASSDTPMTAPTNSASIPGVGTATDVANQLSGQLYGSGYIDAAQAQREQQLRSLHAYDQQLERGYSPFPQVAGYVDNPADLYAAGAGYARGQGGIMSALSGDITGAQQGYQAAIGAVLNKFVDLLTLQENKKQKQEDRDYQTKKDEYDRLWEIAKIKGGSFTDPFTGKTVTVPAPTSAGSASERSTAAALVNIAKDSKSGVPIEDLLTTYSGVADFNDILRVYNENSIYGKAAKDINLYKGIYNKAKAVDAGSGLTATQLSDLRANVASDISTEISNGTPKETIRKKIVAVYPELGGSDIDAILNAMIPDVPQKNQTSQGSGNPLSFLSGLFSPSESPDAVAALQESRDKARSERNSTPAPAPASTESTGSKTETVLQNPFVTSSEGGGVTQGGSTTINFRSPVATREAPVQNTDRTGIPVYRNEISRDIQDLGGGKLMVIIKTTDGKDTYTVKNGQVITSVHSK